MNENTLLFSKTRSVKTPVRAHATDAGIDFFLPDEFTDADLEHSREVTGTYLMFDHSGKSIMIPPHGSLLISSGIRMIVPKGHALIFTNKSGVAAKKHLLVGSCCVDSDYRGETYISLINTSHREVFVSPGEKIVQGIIYEVGSHVPAEVDNIDKYSAPTERGAGGFGSTGV